MLLIFENDLKLQRIGKKRRNRDSSTISTFLLANIIRKEREWYILSRSTHWVEVCLFSSEFFSDAQFKESFRMSRTSFTLFTSFYVPLLRRSQLDFENLFPLIVISLFSCIMSVSALPFLRFQISLLVGKAQFVESLRTLRRLYYSI